MTSTVMTREKTNKIRYFDNDGYRQRAACVCIRNDNENEVLLITSHRDEQTWIVPGGGIEKNETALEAAHREVFEEAGVKGKILRELGVFENCDRKHRTTVYILNVEEETDDWEDKRLIGRQRRWFCLNDAYLHLKIHKPSQFCYLDRLIYSSPNCLHHLINDSKSSKFIIDGVVEQQQSSTSSPNTRKKQQRQHKHSHDEHNS
ncbi:unnamed protein product [Didymodactylos carnosus]|uniref:diphosphoinositol-polyphosphate diphosphatase n=1 Tax=Didymodactylos carnosus TaxID=1234261 RepID=A0A813SWS0_9BILA|nr:unnamed protein product [Didymodactylos carnosus]CAF0900217.1 unnamed protein product [Didymodactylos carnosus]CAF3586933.1 unnamed protein product [Didymodactylos carnosus]CAF3681080.1 unnamed protein product [Didymodactylos carnosus]